MIWYIIKKQMLILWRNPLHVSLLIALPITLIVILGTALGSLLNNEIPQVDIKIAIYEHGDELGEAEQFINELKEKHLLPEEAISEIEAGIQEQLPIKMLKENVFGAEQFSEMIDIESMTHNKKDMADYTAYIEIPNGFTFQFLRNLYLDDSKKPSFDVYGNEETTIGFNVVQTILQQYEEHYTLGKILSNYHVDIVEYSESRFEVTGGIHSVNQKEPIDAKGYYTIAMAVMNVLFVATTISFYTFEEKEKHIFDRILLANISRWHYFFGIFITGFILSWSQLGIIFGVSWLIFDVGWSNLGGYFTVTTSLSLAVSGLTVLLVALNYRLNSVVVTSMFSSILIYIMSLLGGSFFPIGEFSDVIRNLGHMTPNGSALTAYLGILRGDSLMDMSSYLFFLISFSLLCLLMAILSFPKRGEA